jgi:hypothetical protein
MRGLGVFMLAAMIAVMAVVAFTPTDAVSCDNASTIAVNQPPSVSGVPTLAPTVVEATSSKVQISVLPILRTPRVAVIRTALAARRITIQTATTAIEVTTAPRLITSRRFGLLAIRGRLGRPGPAPDH